MTKTKRITTVAMMLCVSIILAILENYLPPIAGSMPGIKMGLSNIVVMFCLIAFNKSTAIYVVILKACFVFLTRGILAFILSICGGICSMAIMTIFILVFKDGVSYIFLSIMGSVTHNMVQLILAVWLTGSKFTFAYMPILLISGIIMGVITGVILNYCMPYLNKLPFTD